MTQIVYLALGSNMGDRQQNLALALAALSPAVTVLRTSPIYETPPWGYADQPTFLNQVVQAETSLPPLELLAYLKELERTLGRKPNFQNGPRQIDIDILLYGAEVLNLPQLVIPHPRMHERGFVLVPLADLAPDLIHPVLGRSIRDLLGTVDRAGITPLAARARAPRPFPLEWGKRTYVMGILNLTTDSFSGDGLLTEADVLPTALAQARRFISAGADILDIGGESTRPGSAPVSAEDELRRVLPVLRALIAEGVDAILSVDTYKALVAEAALAAGADWINDVWALRADPGMAALAARTRAPLILMHNRLKPNSAELQERLGGRYVGVEYENLLADVKRELMESVEIARAAGVSDDRIILDPGLGFGKTVEHSLELVDRLDEIRALGFPLLVGPSRKSFIGYTLNLPPDQRVEGTAAAVAVSIARGADIIRVHDVEAMARVAHMTDAITRRGAPGGK